MTVHLIKGGAGVGIGSLKDAPVSEKLDFLPSVVNSGSCEVKMRILPSNSGIIESNFDTFSPNGGTDEEGNILTNLEVSPNTVKKTFILAPKPGANKVYFSLTSPMQSKTVSVGLIGNNIEIPIKYVLQDALNKGGDYVLSYKISSDKYVIKDESDKKIELSFNDDDWKKEKIKLSIPNALSDKLTSAENVSYVSGSIGGVESAAELTLTYEIVASSGTGGGKTSGSSSVDSNKINGGSVKLYIRK
jgi:hypothetical protein